MAVALGTDKPWRVPQQEEEKGISHAEAQRRREEEGKGAWPSGQLVIEIFDYSLKLLEGGVAAMAPSYALPCHFFLSAPLRLCAR